MGSRGLLSMLHSLLLLRFLRELLMVISLLWLWSALPL
jgi:hypothetical protein